MSGKLLCQIIVLRVLGADRRFAGRTAEDASSFGSLFRLIPSPTSWPGSSPLHQWSGASGQSEYRVCGSPRIDSRRCKAYFPYRSRQGWNPSWRPACPPRPLPRLPRNTIAGAFRRLTYLIGPRQTRRDPTALEEAKPDLTIEAIAARPAAIAAYERARRSTTASSPAPTKRKNPLLGQTAVKAGR